LKNHKKIHDEQDSEKEKIHSMDQDGQDVHDLDTTDNSNSVEKASFYFNL
jgi:hypothetical protein